MRTESNAFAKVLAQRTRGLFPGWHCVLATTGLEVYQSGETTKSFQAYPLNQDRGVTLGLLFRRNANNADDTTSASLTSSDVRKIQETKGRHLVHQFWGRYVAIVKEQSGQVVWVLRDPTGSLPCFVTQAGGVHVVFSDVKDCLRLNVLDLSINWNHIAAYLWYDRLIGKDTALQNVWQVQAGECVTLDAAPPTAAFYWNPARVHDARIVDSDQQAMSELRAVVQHCVQAWAGCFDRILHELSGGLDSAVVLACLSQVQSKPIVVCENYFTESATGDERKYARKAAKSANRELIETLLVASDERLDRLLDSSTVTTPAMATLVSSSESARIELIREREIQAVFSGQGGDHFFQQRKSHLVAADYAWRHGLQPALVKVIRDTALLTRSSIWSVVSDVVQFGLRRQRFDPYDVLVAPRLMHKDALDAFDRKSIRHPWVDSAAHLPGNKRLQVFSILDSQNFYHRRTEYAELVHPLISQPIIELCLQIPSYLLSFGGVDRALARAAFSDVLPFEVIQRTCKGATGAYYSTLLLNNLSFLRNALLGGLLVEARLLDAQKVESCLRESVLVRDSHLLFPILDAIRAEDWLRAWTGKELSAAA
jgi:asparagine synthase (glutamine-hydrolysing)